MSDTVEALARRYHAELLRILRARLPNAQDADDLAQEAYTRLLRYEGRIEPDQLRPVLFRIASNLMTDHWRWMRLRQAGTQLPIEELEFDSEEPSHDRHVDAEQQLRRLEQVVLGMPEKRRLVFLLSRIEGLSNAEIATRCGISIKTVEKHLAIALAECRKQVGQPDAGSP
ncbi:RNA polymerase sigma factor [Steroidobacter sp.]|uniref:RNA polymerase sigma factor n=1 Tax=Steroidobacter sp. TaxID=1978227 RepID=UPI001A505F34|nr:RNA polymerase sigma factor [Steroidobacter sp.]MBL8268767.1 RNA polymerase sigma factor [Steroidobacter sp.]